VLVCGDRVLAESADILDEADANAVAYGCGGSPPPT
jgi:hypothetical protein